MIRFGVKRSGICICCGAGRAAGQTRAVRAGRRARCPWGGAGYLPGVRGVGRATGQVSVGWGGLRFRLILIMLSFLLCITINYTFKLIYHDCSYGICIVF